MVRLVHTADVHLHLDAPERRDALAAVLDRAESTSADAVTIGGDLFEDEVAAERLLAGEPGFLLLDDPLLPADPERLAAAFDALRSLAADGWQVVYFTARPEVGVELVERHGVPCRRFERLARDGTGLEGLT